MLCYNASEQLRPMKNKEQISGEENLKDKGS